MTALVRERSRREESWKRKEFTLQEGFKALKGGAAALVLGTAGEVIPGESAAGLFIIGTFAKTVDATDAAKRVTVIFPEEIWVERFVNATGGDAVLSTDIGRMAYQMDDQTVCITGAGRSVSGRVWDIDSVKGVAVEMRAAWEGGAGALSPSPEETTFTSNDWAPATIESGSTYIVPVTAGASTITLPAAAPNGTIAYFLADGTNNGHTVQYRDATGPVNLTTALTASKRHLVIVAKRDGVWAANAYVAP
jgi:hypothetical protein